MTLGHLPREKRPNFFLYLILTFSNVQSFPIMVLDYIHETVFHVHNIRVTPHILHQCLNYAAVCHVSLQKL